MIAPAPVRAGQPLVVRNITAGYGRVTVLHGISFEAAPGEVLGIGGPNGAGKTTLLNAIAGLNRGATGDVLLGGHSLRGQGAHQRVASGLALVPEGRQIIGALTVRANLDVTLMARGKLRPDAEHRARLEHVFGLFPNLARRLGVSGLSLSGGEQQMLAIARALMTNPSVLLLDEPSQGLAPAIVGSVVEVLRSLRGSVTMVLVEQNTAVLEALADRLLLLRFGRVVDERRV